MEAVDHSSAVRLVNSLHADLFPVVIRLKASHLSLLEENVDLQNITFRETRINGFVF